MNSNNNQSYKILEEKKTPSYNQRNTVNHDQNAARKQPLANIMLPLAVKHWSGLTQNKANLLSIFLLFFIIIHWYVNKGALYLYVHICHILRKPTSCYTGIMNTQISMYRQSVSQTRILTNNYMSINNKVLKKSVDPD